MTASAQPRTTGFPLEFSRGVARSHRRLALPRLRFGVSDRAWRPLPFVRRGDVRKMLARRSAFLPARPVQRQCKTCAAKPDARAGRTPRILYVSREFWKAGHETPLNRIESEAARVCIGLGVPHPYLGIESLTGPKEVWYVNGFASTEELEQVKEAYGKNQELLAAMNRFARQRSEFELRSSEERTATYRPALSRGAEWQMGRDRFLVISVTTRDPQENGSVFESEDGVRFVVTGARTRTEAEAKRAAAGADAKVFAVRPEFSMPAPEWIASDPSFWRSTRQKN